MNRKSGFQVVVASLFLAAGMLIAAVPGYAETQGQERRDDRQGARDTRQDGRQDARVEKAECRAGDEKSRPECRQDKRGDKQDTREQARDIKY